MTLARPAGPAGPRPRHLAAALLVTALALAGCSSDDEADPEKDAAPTSTPRSETTPAESVETSTAAALPQAPGELYLPSFDTTGLSVEQVVPGADGEIRLPGQTVQIEAIAVVPSVIDPDGAELGPAEGETFRVVTLTSTYGDAYRWDVPAAQVFVVDGGVRTNVFDEDDDLTQPDPFLVSVGDDATLVVAVDGHEVTASLATGARLADPVTDVLYREPVRQDPGQQLRFTTVPVRVDGDPYDIQYAATVDSVELAPYLPSELTGTTGQWAEAGMTWALVDVSSKLAVVIPDPGCCSVHLDSTVQKWSVEVDGTRYSGGDLQFASALDDDQVTYVEIPATAVDLTLLVTSSTRITDGVGQVARHGSQSLDVAFG